MNNGVPMFPPKNVLYPACCKIAFIKLVVVVFPSLPVTPIILHGHISISISTSVVTIAPLSASCFNSGLVGKQLGDLKITLNPFNFSRQFFPNDASNSYVFIFAIVSIGISSSVLSSNTVTCAFLLCKYSNSGKLLTPKPITATFLNLIYSLNSFNFLFS